MQNVSARTFGTMGLVLSLLLLTGAFQEIAAQATGPVLRSVDRPIRIGVDPTYQSVSEGERSISQLSTRLSAVVPIGQRFQVRAQASYAQTSGDSLAQVQGLTDILGSVTYAQPLQDGSLVFQLNTNIPVGKTGLSSDELQTTRFSSQNFYDFRVSSYGGGFSATPSVTWAVPVTDNLVAGIGASYQYQGGYQPWSSAVRQQRGLDEGVEYVPGNGIGAKGGLDYKINSGSLLGFDASFRRYGADQTGGVDQFDAGNRIAGSLRYLYRSGFTTVRTVARYANWDKSEFAFQQDTGPDRGQVIPSHGQLQVMYRTRLSSSFWVTARTSGHWYGESAQTDLETLQSTMESEVFGRVYVSPAYELADTVVLAPHGTVAYGTFLSVRGGLRLEARF